MFNTLILEENVSRFPDLVEYPEITDEETLRDLVGEPVVISQYQSTIDDLFERLIDIGVRCWNIRNEDGVKLQETVIKVKRDEEDPKTYAIPFNRLMLSVAYIIPVIQYLKEIDLNDFLLKGPHRDVDSYRLQDQILAILKSHCIPIDRLQEIASDLAMSLKTIMKTFSMASMIILTAENLFLDHYMESKIVREINNTYYPDTVQPSEVIEQNAEKYKKLAAEMLLRGNPIFVMDQYTKLLKPKQIEESMINFGHIPDGKKLVTLNQNGNGCWGGYHELSVLYAAAIGARVPDLMNTEKMGGAGYFSRNLMILTYGTLAKVVFDCGSVNKLKVDIDEDIIDMYDGRYYATSEDSDVLRIFHSSDKSNIGKTFWFRSPCTCNLNEDVCHTCYGIKALNVGDLEGGFIYTTEIATSRISQNILSAKHILKANAKKVEFSSNFDKYFEFEASAVFPIDDKPFDIFIPENWQDDISEHFTVYVKKGKNLEPITISNYWNAYVSDEMLDKCKEVEIDDITYFKISSSKVLEIEDGNLCTITPINIMETQKYENIKRLIENELPKMNTMEEAVSMLNHYTHKIIPTLAVHNELIIGRHLRNVNNILLRPNWLNPNEPYKMLRLRSALENIEAFTTAISFEKPYEAMHKTIFDERNKINRVGPRGMADFTYGQRKNF